MNKNKTPSGQVINTKDNIQQIEKSVFDLTHTKEEKDNKSKDHNFKGTPKKINLDGVFPYVPSKK